MDYEVREPPKDEPITLEEAKLHLRTITGDTVEDAAIIAPMITAAREFAENVTGQALAKQVIAAWPEALETMMRMPLAPVGNVQSLTLTLEDGTAQVAPAGSYLVLSTGDICMVRMPEGRLRAVRPVEVVYEAGFTELPKALRQAMLLMIGHWYTNRETVITGSTTAVEVPLAARTLMNQYKRWWC